MAVRSRGTLEQIRKRIVEGDIAETLAQAAVEALRNGGLVDKAGKEIKGTRHSRPGRPC